jgi:hypothetical protein|tara:strand:+ start:493 stop:720 length:228 start_codon:yes stop_codon:yes gene_type:complete
LQVILPYLVTKKERAKIAITLGQRITNRIGYKVKGKGYKGLGGAGICEDELKIRNELMNQIRFLNSGTKHLIEYN